MWGGDDPCDRWPMFWDDLTYERRAADPLNRPRAADEVGVDSELLQFYREAIALRKVSAVLRRGSLATVAADDNAQFFAFRRELDGKQVLVALNRGDKSFTWTLPIVAEKLAIAFTTDERTKLVTSKDDRQQAELPALTAVVLAEP
jgi:glycosidase